MVVQAHEKIALKGLKFSSLDFFFLQQKVIRCCVGRRNNNVAEKDLTFIGSTKSFGWAKCEQCGINDRKWEFSEL